MATSSLSISPLTFSSSQSLAPPTNFQPTFSFPKFKNTTSHHSPYLQIRALTLDFSGSFFERGSEDDGGSSDGGRAASAAAALEEKEEPQCPPGLRQYETMAVLRPDMTEDERLGLTQKYEEVIKMEADVLKLLDFQLSVPTIKTFLRFTAAIESNLNWRLEKQFELEIYLAHWLKGDARMNGGVEGDGSERFTAAIERRRLFRLLVAGGGMYVEVFNRGVIPLAYSIKKKNKAGESNTYLDGIYLLFTYFTKPDSIRALETRLQADDDVIRSSTFKIKKRKLN